jgi:ketosteroid isomerase-like protein
MSNNNAEVIRRAYQAYANGDLAAMLELVDPELEWTYLDPTLQHPTPQVCHGRHELEQVLRGWAEHGVRAELEEVTSSGDWSWWACGRQGSTLVSAGAGTTAPTACSRCARGGSLPCATAVIARRPSRLPASRCEQPDLAALRRLQGRSAVAPGGCVAAGDRWRPVALAGLDPVAAAIRAGPPARGCALAQLRRDGDYADAAAWRR